MPSQEQLRNLQPQRFYCPAALACGEGLRPTKHCCVLTQNRARVNVSSFRSSHTWAPCLQGHVTLQQSNLFHWVASGQSPSLASTSYCLRGQWVSKITAVKLHTHIRTRGWKWAPTPADTSGSARTEKCVWVPRAPPAAAALGARVRRAAEENLHTRARALVHTHTQVHNAHVTRPTAPAPHTRPRAPGHPRSASSASACARTDAYTCIPRARSAPRGGNQGRDPRG